MATKLWLEINRVGGVIERREVQGGESVGTVEGACPGCGAVPFMVQGMSSATATSCVGFARSRSMH